MAQTYVDGCFLVLAASVVILIAMVSRSGLFHEKIPCLAQRPIAASMATYSRDITDCLAVGLARRSSDQEDT